MALTQTQVSQLYVSIFNRASEGNGNTYWQTNGADLASVATEMLATTDAATYFGSSLDTNQAFVEHIYLNTLNKTTADDAAGIAYWVAELDSGVSRGQMVANLVTAATLAENAGAAQDQFNNRVTVSNYTADTLAAAPTDYSTSLSFASGLTVTSDAATVTTAQTSVDDIANPGSTFSLTTGSDIIESGASNDKITATNLTLLNGDVIIDESTTDADVMNLTVKAAPATAATVENIEKINVTIDAFNGAFNAFDANKTVGATITVSSEKLGYNGKAQIANAKTNNVTAGTNVDDLTVTGLTTGKVDLGSASTASITGTANKDANVTVNGDVDLTMVTATNLILTATDTATVDLTAGAVTDIEAKGADDLTIIINGTTVTDIVDSTTAGTLTAEIAVTAVDGTNFAVDTVDISANIAAFKAATDANVELTESQTALTVTGQSATNGNVVISTAVDHTSLTLSALKTATINTTDALDIATLVTGGATTTLNVDGDTTISTALNATGDDFVITGTGDVDIATGNADSVDASGLTGGLTYTTTVSANIKGGSGENEITVGAATLVDYTGGADVDEIDATALLGGTLAASLGAGNDIVNFSAALTGTVAMDGGTGTDTVNLGDTTNTGVNYSGYTTWAVTNFENLTFTDLNGTGTIVAQTATVTSKQAESFSSLSITADKDGDTDDTAVLTITASKAVDLSGLTVEDTAAITTVITAYDGVANTTATSITTTNGADDITVADNDSSKTYMLSITDFNMSAAGIADTLTLGQATHVTDAAGVDATALTASVFGNAVNPVTYTVKDGILTFNGTTADLAPLDTLSEWIALAAEIAGDEADAVDSIGFEFGGNTYILETSNNGSSDAVLNVIELVDVTGVVALDGSQGANTVLLA